MLNLYNPLALTEEQKLVYVKLLIYLAKSDNNPDSIEQTFIKKIIARFQLPPTVLVGLNVPKSIDDLFSVVQPIKDRAIAVDLVHCLWFAASVDGEIANEEVLIIRNVARLLNIGDDTILILNNFVLDELTFLQQACDFLETEEVRC